MTRDGGHLGSVWTYSTVDGCVLCEVPLYIYCFTCMHFIMPGMEKMNMHL